MLQRGLGILPSICILSDIAYAMSPQPDVGTVSAVPNISNAENEYKITGDNAGVESDAERICVCLKRGLINGGM